MSTTQTVKSQQSDQPRSTSLKHTAGSLTVTVLMGGPSSERQISLKSGKAVAAALGQMGHDVVCADIGPENFTALERENLDVVFPALHGSFGEDGTIQAVMDQRKVRYCGSGPHASRLAMDKMDSKWRFLQAGIPTPQGGLIDPNTPAKLRARLLERLGTPLVIKPINQGSSLDVVVAADAKQRDQAIEQLIQKYGRCMAERFLPGREFTVAILAEQALPVVEIVTPDGFFDFQSKYESSDTGYLLDIDLPSQLCRDMQQLALQAHRVLGCRDFSRVDIRLDAQARPTILEVNTIPGLTSRSLLPMAGAKAGIEFPQLCDKLVRMAYQHPDSSVS